MLALESAIESLVTAKGRLPEAGVMLDRYSNRRDACELYAKAYRNYCWPVNSLADFKLAPFHILATEGAVHTDKNHLWHMEKLHKVVEAGGALFQTTQFRTIDITDDKSVSGGIDWWLEMTSKGGEGMVVKPLDFIAKGKKGLVQPAVKCRGKEYLRIIYGPEYTLPDNLARLKSRGLSHKRSMALREFALGVESLERFVRKEPLRRIHECVFGVLALESEPVDPRL